MGVQPQPLVEVEPVAADDLRADPLQVRGQPQPRERLGLVERGQIESVPVAHVVASAVSRIS